jgi:hypothetical protein
VACVFPASALHLELPVLIEQVAVHADFAVGAHIADHVPVQGGFVLAARLRIAGAKRYLDGNAPRSSIRS